LVFLNKKALELKNSLKRLHIKNFKNSSFLAFAIVVFFLISLLGYIFLERQMTQNHEKDAKILFYKIQNKTSELLSQVLHRYTIERKQLLQKHKEILHYLKSLHKNPLNVDLHTIYEKINENSSIKPYNIYITDENYVIRNTTFKRDKNFDISFARTIFETHAKKKTIGVSTPLFEQSSKELFSYTDSYINANHKNILQISYTYHESKENLLEIQNLIANYPNISDVRAYIINNDGFVNKLILKNVSLYKPSLEKTLQEEKRGEQINKQLQNRVLVISHFQKNGNSYTRIYMTLKSPIIKTTKILYSILLNENEFESQLRHLKYLLFLILFFGIVAIFFTLKMRTKEIKFTEQDRFMQGSMHELKTPLSIITLNNELRELEYGIDEYSQEISNAIKTLKSSYDDISFTLTHDGINYPQELFSLSKVLHERVTYFKSIIAAKNKTLQLHIEGNCQVKISLIELIRLIDNNLSNAIKYSKPKNTITVTLNNGALSFHTFGEPIHNKEKIFEKYRRENSVVGGHGLGLSIVKEIAKKYAIKIELTSSQKNGTTFSYIFQCHTDDI